MYDEPEVIARSAQELVGDLNPQQAEAVQYRGQALLIGAGAGSGSGAGLGFGTFFGGSGAGTGGGADACAAR